MLFSLQSSSRQHKGFSFKKNPSETNGEHGEESRIPPLPTFMVVIQVKPRSLSVAAPYESIWRFDLKAWAQHFHLLLDYDGSWSFPQNNPPSPDPWPSHAPSSAIQETRKEQSDPGSEESLRCLEFVMFLFVPLVLNILDFILITYVD